MQKNQLKIATRKSKLALWQANFVKSALEKKYPDLEIKLVEISTEGDLNQTDSFEKINGKSIFVKALQEALLNNQADIAVHSIKDMSVFPVDNLLLGAICQREDARDAFISEKYHDLNDLPSNAIVGSSSPRRTALLKSLRPDIQIKLLRGNVDTRILKLKSSEYDAIVLAAAGLKRLNLTDNIKSYFSPEIFTPAIGQGAIGIECRHNDLKTREFICFLNHAESEYCVAAERAINQILGGNCYTPIGAHAQILNNKILLRAMVASLDGKIILRSCVSGEINQAEKLGEYAANELLKQGAKKLCLF